VTQHSRMLVCVICLLRSDEARGHMTHMEGLPCAWEAARPSPTARFRCLETGFRVVGSETGCQNRMAFLHSVTLRLDPACNRFECRCGESTRSAGSMLHAPCRGASTTRNNLASRTGRALAAQLRQVLREPAGTPQNAPGRDPNCRRAGAFAPARGRLESGPAALARRASDDPAGPALLHFRHDFLLIDGWHHCNSRNPRVSAAAVQWNFAASDPAYSERGIPGAKTKVP
jgi:hypothetical protein